MARVMFQGFAAQPAAQAVAEEIVCEIGAPQGAIRNARLGERTIQIQQADEARPLAAPVGDREDGAAMRRKPGQQMMAVLPDRFDNDERRMFGNVAEYLHTALL